MIKPVIETPRLLLFSYQVDVLDDLHSILSDATTMQFWPQPYSLQQSREWLEYNMTTWRETGLGRLAVRLKSTGQLIGDAGIKQTMVNEQLENDMGYIIHHTYWKQGYGFEVAQGILDYGLHTRQLSRIVANMPHDHFASAKVAEKLGMKKVLEFHNSRNRNILTYLYIIENS